MVDQDQLREEWKRLSVPWIYEARHGRNPTREGLLDEPVLEACGDLTGLSVIDLGCGEGRFCRKMLELGASRALGVDLCEPMIRAASELPAEGAEYMLADAQELGSLETSSFDLAVSYLNQCDLPDFMANTREVLRLLRPGGRFVVANLHPMRSAVGSWHPGGDGGKAHVILDRYFDEGERRWRMLGEDFTNFHRTLSTYINGFLAAGFRLTGLIEPSVSEEKLKEYPELVDESRVPNFIIYVLEKPSAGE